MRETHKVIRKSEIVPVVMKKTFPELQHIRDHFDLQTEKKMKEIEYFCTIVETLNSGLEDSRLDTDEGTMQALVEMRDYNVITRRKNLPVFNPKTESNTPKVFFEV